MPPNLLKSKGSKRPRTRREIAIDDLIQRGVDRFGWDSHGYEFARPRVMTAAEATTDPRDLLDMVQAEPVAIARSRRPPDIRIPMRAAVNAALPRPGAEAAVPQPRIPMRSARNTMVPGEYASGRSRPRSVNGLPMPMQKPMGVQPVDSSRYNPLTIWPVPGYGELNVRDTSRRQGGGWFDAPRVSDDGTRRSHAGVDVTALEGTPVYAAGAGIVSVAQRGVPGKGYGNLIEIDHGGQIKTRYAHLEEFAVELDDLVQTGQLVGWSGSSGNPPPEADKHLHYEVRVNGVAVDPLTFQAYREW